MLLDSDSDWLHYAARFNHRPGADGWFRILEQIDPVGVPVLTLDILPVGLDDPPAVPDDPADLFPALVDLGGLADQLSFKCRAYGDQPHSPCSGTTDDGTDRACQHWCHTGDTVARGDH